MKKFFALLSVVVAMFVAGCAKKEPAPPTTPAPPLQPINRPKNRRSKRPLCRPLAPARGPSCPVPAVFYALA